MSKPADLDIERYLDAIAPAVGVSIPEQHRPLAVIYLKAAFVAVQPLMDFELDETVEPAPVFRP